MNKTKLTFKWKNYTGLFRNRKEEVAGKEKSLPKLTAKPREINCFQRN
jgi:hypothetical protein